MTTPRRLAGLVSLVAFAGTVLAANAALDRWGIIPIGFGLTAPAGWAGTRGVVQLEAWHSWLRENPPLPGLVPSEMPSLPVHREALR